MKKSLYISLNPLLIQGTLYVYLLAILVVAVFPFSATGMRSVNSVYVVNFRLDHLLHLAVFAPLYPLLHLNRSPYRQKGSVLLLAVAMGLALMSEGVQYFMAWRTYNPADLISNVAGVLLGFMAGWGLSRFIRVSVSR